MRMPQKMLRVRAVMTHQAAQGRAIALPVMHAQLIRLHFIQLQMLLQIRRHAAIDVRKDVRRSIMQRVIQIKDPKPLTHSQRPLYNVASEAEARQKMAKNRSLQVSKRSEEHTSELQ